MGNISVEDVVKAVILVATLVTTTGVAFERVHRRWRKWLAGELHNQLAPLKAEFGTNGGSSLVDKVDSLQRSVDETATKLTQDRAKDRWELDQRHAKNVAEIEQVKTEVRKLRRLTLVLLRRVHGEDPAAAEQIADLEAADAEFEDRQARGHRDR